MSRETVHSRSYATFFRHSAVLLRKLANNSYPEDRTGHMSDIASKARKQNAKVDVGMTANALEHVFATIEVSDNCRGVTLVGSRKGNVQNHHRQDRGGS